MIGAFIFGALTALGIGLLGRNRRVGHDTAIGVVFAAFFALGIVLLSSQQGFRQDLNALLFGNILGVSREDILISLVVALVVTAIVLALLKELVLVAFDRVLASSASYPVFALDMLLLLLVTTTVVVSLQTVGNLLILALLVTPAAAARLLTDRLYRMLLLSVLITVASGVLGLYISYYAEVSTSGAIALTATGCFVLAYIFAPQHGLLSQRLLRRRGLHHQHHFHPHDEELDVH
jgi:manganese/iron transport system permease protein